MSRVRRSPRSTGSIPPASSPTICAAIGAVHPPVNTERRRRRRRSSSSRRSQLQSISACSVCCRGTAVRRPPASRRNRSPSRTAMSSGDIADTRAAASSIASGMPSSAGRSRRPTPTLDSRSTNCRSTVVARSVNSRTASVAAASSRSSAAVPEHRRSCAADRRARQGLQLEDRLAGHRECLAARRQDAQARRVGEQPFGQVATPSTRCSALSSSSSSPCRRGTP